MNRVTEIYDTTIEMLQLLEQWDTKETDREQLINKMVPLLEIREQLIMSLQVPYTKAEIMLGKKILLLNETLEAKMSRLFDAVKHDMKKVKEKKELNYSYINPYGNMRTVDGMYVDNKL